MCSIFDNSPVREGTGYPHPPGHCNRATLLYRESFPDLLARGIPAPYIVGIASHGLQVCFVKKICIM